MTLDSVFRIFSVLCLSLLLSGGTAMAQQEQSIPVVPQGGVPAPQAPQSLPTDDEEITILRDDFAGKYNASTLDNLSKVYWRLGAFDFDDDSAVGNFIKINDCKIFTEYINDDLEWKEIVGVMKKNLVRNKDTYPLNFQFVLQLHLGRYDTALGGFPLVDKTGFKDSKRIEVDSIDSNQEVCFDAGPIKDYPKSLILLLPEPLTLDFLKLNEHVAQAYILRKKSEFSKLSEDVRSKRYERDAYLRLRVTFSQYHGNLLGDNNIVMAILFATIDGYEIFEDVGQKRLMLSVDLKDKQKTENTQMSIPVQPAAAQTPATSPAPPAPSVVTSSQSPERKPAPVQ